VIRIVVTEAAYAVIDRALPGVALNQIERTGTDKVFVWLDRATANRFERLRQPDEHLSDVIVRLAEGSNGTTA
jgi:hypothetical protein